LIGKRSSSAASRSLLALSSFIDCHLPGFDGGAGLAWQFLLQRKGATQAQVILALNQGYFFNNLLPFRIGELARAFLLGRRSHLGMFYVLSTIVVERSYDLALPLAAADYAAHGLTGWNGPVRSRRLLLVIIIAGLFALYLAARNREWVEGQVERLAGRWGLGRRLGAAAAARAAQRLFRAHPL
jgi:hypothetical protein